MKARSDKSTRWRKVLVYRPIEVSLKDIKKGDLFRVLPVSAEDPVDGNELSIATKDANHCGGKAEWEVESIPVCITQKINIKIA